MTTYYKTSISFLKPNEEITIIPLDKVILSKREKDLLKQIFEEGIIKFEYSPFKYNNESKSHFMSFPPKEKTYKLTKSQKSNIQKFIDYNNFNNENKYYRGFNYTNRMTSVMSVIDNINYGLDLERIGYGEGIPNNDYNTVLENNYKNTPIPPIYVKKTDDNKYYIQDGHNRAIGSIIKGYTNIPAVIINITKKKTKRTSSASRRNNSGNNPSKTFKFTPIKFGGNKYTKKNKRKLKKTTKKTTK